MDIAVRVLGYLAIVVTIAFLLTRMGGSGG
jgi:uncharacterized membrane protein